MSGIAGLGLRDSFDHWNKKLEGAFTSGRATEWLLLSGGANVSTLSSNRNSA